MVNLFQIHHEDGQGDDTFGRFGESGVDFAQTALQLGQAEFPFDFHSLADVPVVLFSVRFNVHTLLQFRILLMCLAAPHKRRCLYQEPSPHEWSLREG